MTDHFIIQGDSDTKLDVEVKGDSVIFSILKRFTQADPSNPRHPLHLDLGHLAIRKVDWSDINEFVRNECERQRKVADEATK